MTVEADPVLVETRLAGGQLACPGCEESLRPWGWARARVVHGVTETLRPLGAHRVAREDVPTKIGRGGPVEIPAVLLARLALSEPLRGQQLGAVLLADALERIIDATQTVAARLVVVDALHERVAQFYESLGFRRIPSSLLLVQKITDIEAALRKPE